MSQETTRTRGLTRRTYQMQIPVFIVSAISAIFFVNYFGTPYPPIKAITDNFTMSTTILVALGDVYGYAVLTFIHIRRVSSNRERPEYRRTLIKSGTVLTTSLFFAILAWFFGGVRSSTYTFWLMAIPTMTAVSANMVWVFHAYTPFRMLRITSVETLLFFITFLLTCTGQMSLLTTIWPPFAPITTWMQSVPSVAVQRASLMAAAVGSIVLAVRALLAREPGLVEMEVH